jgi:uncharacterized protein YegP (UPF0339 family)
VKNPLRFIIRPDQGGGYHVQLVDRNNHEIIFWTENYRDVRDARRAIALVKRNVASATVLDLTRLRRLRRAS